MEVGAIGQESSSDEGVSTDSGEYTIRDGSLPSSGGYQQDGQLQDAPATEDLDNTPLTPGESPSMDSSQVGVAQVVEFEPHRFRIGQVVAEEHEWWILGLGIVIGMMSTCVILCACRHYL